MNVFSNGRKRVRKVVRNEKRRGIIGGRVIALHD